ncbi:MAG: ABC transporter permease, partial [Gaiellales bacterium]
VVSVVTGLLAVVVVLPVAYATVRRRSRIGEAAGAMITGGFALPGLVVAPSLVFWALGAPGPIGALYQTTPLLVLAYVINFGALAMRTSQVAVAGVPGQMTDAARLLGAGRLRRFTRVELPLMVPGLLAAGGLVLLSTMKELPATLLLAPPGFQTLATKIWAATEQAFLAEASVAALVLVALSAILTYTLVIRRATALR